MRGHGAVHSKGWCLSQPRQFRMVDHCGGVTDMIRDLLVGLTDMVDCLSGDGSGH
ncbi:hypothetical protein D3C81_2304360 [compost metagenome]